VALLATLWPAVAWSQSAEPEASLTARVASDKTSFAIGELITLELEFRGRGGPDDAFSTWANEDYTVTPEAGVEDPLAEFHRSGFGVVGSGFSSLHPLDGRPYRDRVHLNDRVRFTKPGEYRVVVTSRRLTRSRKTEPLTSNPVAIRIVTAPPDWAAAELARATALLDAGTREGIREGLAILRHLGTRDAALVLVARHGTGGAEHHYDVRFGLTASPWRADVLFAMEARLDAGAVLSPGFISDLSFLRSLADHPADATDPLHRIESLHDLECAYTNRWSRGITKRGASVDVLASVLSAEPEPTRCDVWADFLARHPDVARGAFLALPKERQALLLEHQWPLLDRGWIGPALELLYGQWRGEGRFAGAGDQALVRIFQADRDRGEALLAEEVRTGAHRIVAKTLLSFPEDAVRGLDDDTLMKRLMAQHAEPAGVTALWMIARYGSPALAPVVREMVRCAPPCEVEAAAIAYLLKHDPDAGLARLQPDFDRSCGGCVLPPWTELGSRVWDDRIEAAALSNLRSGSVAACATATQALQAYGSAAVKEPLIARLGVLKREWKGQEAELAAMENRHPGRPSNPDSPMVIENALVFALLSNPRLDLTEDDVARILASCVSPSCRGNVEAMARVRRDTHRVGEQPPRQP
jgi:hypothetical protein